MCKKCIMKVYPSRDFFCGILVELGCVISHPSRLLLSFINSVAQVLQNFPSSVLRSYMNWCSNNEESDNLRRMNKSSNELLSPSALSLCWWVRIMIWMCRRPEAHRLDIWQNTQSRQDLGQWSIELPINNLAEILQLRKCCWESFRKSISEAISAAQSNWPPELQRNGVPFYDSGRVNLTVWKNALSPGLDSWIMINPMWRNSKYCAANNW